MYKIMIWNDLEEDFIDYRDITRAVVKFDTETDALISAARVKELTGEQTRVQFIRNVQRAKKTARIGRVQRFGSTVWAGERVKVVAFDSSGRKIK